MARRISSGEPTRLQPTRNERTSSEEPQDLGQPPNSGPHARTPSRRLAHTHSLSRSITHAQLTKKISAHTLDGHTSHYGPERTCVLEQ